MSERSNRKSRREADSRRDSAAAAVPAPPRPLFTTGRVALLLALLVIVFFHEVSLGGKTFVSPDATAPLGFVRQGEISLWQHHVYPLWNPYVFLGMPSFGSGAYNPLIYPPDWPLALVAKVVPLPDMTWMLIYYILGGLFMYLLAREWGARPEGALLGAFAFVFAPNLVAVGSHGHGSQLVNSAYAPLLLWLAARWMRRGSLADLGWLMLAGGFQMLRGHVQIAYYSWLAVGLYAGFEWFAGLRDRARLPAVTARAAAVALAAVVAFGIAGFFNLPLRDYAKYSIRGGGEGGGTGIEYATQWSLMPHELPSVVVPGWAGFGNPTYWGGMPFTDYPNAHLGMIAVLLLLPAFLARGTPRLFALTLAVFSILVAFGKNFPLYGLLYDHLPLFNKFRIPVMIVLLLQVAAAAGLAWGWSAVLDRPAAAGGRGRAAADPLDRMLLVAAGLVAAWFVIGFLGQGMWQEAYVRFATGHRQGYPPDLAAAAYRGYVSDLARVSLLGLAALGVAWFVRRGRLGAAVATGLVLVLLAVELWPVSGRVMAPTIGPVAERESGRDDIVEFLEKAGPPGSFRILSAPEFQNNRFAGFAIAQVGGYHAAKPRLIQDLIESGVVDDPYWMRLLNVRYLVLAGPIEPVPPFLREVHRGSQVIYENMVALPRATVLGAYRVAPSARAILDSVRRGEPDGAEVAWLERDPGLALGPVAGATAAITRYELNRVTLKVETPGPALVRLADAWYPDWTVRVDGAPAELLRADYLLRAVAVPAGAHEVEFRFESPPVRTGLTLSLVSAALALALIGLGVWTGRRRAVPPAAAGEAAAG